MTDINWSLLQMPDFGAAAMQGYERGRAVRREREQQSALSAYAQDPSEQNMNALLPFMQPNQAFQVVQQRQQVHAQQQQAQNDHLKQSVGQAVLDIMRRPEDQRSMMWDAYVDQFARTNPNAEQYRGRYSEAAAMAVLAEQGLVEEYQKSSTPPKTALQQNYEFLNGMNPQYGRQYIERQVSEPPMIAGNGDGTFTVIPRSQMQPAARQPSPTLPSGFVVDGGPTQPASGGFPGN